MTNLEEKENSNINETDVIFDQEIEIYYIGFLTDTEIHNPSVFSIKFIGFRILFEFLRKKCVFRPRCEYHDPKVSKYSL